MKYIHLYSDTCYCESDSFKGTPNTIELNDDLYEELGKTLCFKNGQLSVKVKKDANIIHGNV